jgi:D-glycero-D-manno-heptose 1,7-bisphosphate phosphatase
VRHAVFLDRDGTINQEKDYLYRIEDFEFVPGAPQAIRLLNEAGLLVVVVSNQSGVARGYYTEADVEKLHHHISAELAISGARVDAWLYCPHHPSGKGSYAVYCNCRKPLPGMLLDAAAQFGIDLAASVMIGDKLVDMEAGHAAGCRTILVRSGYGVGMESSIDSGIEVYDDLLRAVLTLLGKHDVI